MGSSDTLIRHDTLTLSSNAGSKPTNTEGGKTQYDNDQDTT